MANPAAHRPRVRPLRDFHPGRGRIARANDRDQRQGKYARLTADCDQRRRIVDHLQPARIIGLAERDQCNAELGGGFDLARRVVARTDLRRGRAAAAAGQGRQGRERGTRAAVMIEERSKRARTDILRSDEPQPVEPLLSEPSAAAMPIKISDLY
jgi:hypothetical protein